MPLFLIDDLLKSKALIKSDNIFNVTNRLHIKMYLDKKLFEESQDTAVGCQSKKVFYQAFSFGHLVCNQFKQNVQTSQSSKINSFLI